MSPRLIWEGETAPVLIDDLHKWDEAPQKLLRAGTGLWSFSMPLPSDAYLEYAFIDPETGERIPDPLNPLRISRTAPTIIITSTCHRGDPLRVGVNTKRRPTRNGHPVYGSHQ